MITEFTERPWMPILQYHDREALKRSQSSQLATDWAHYHRFMEQCLRPTQPQVYFEGAHPTFAEFRRWKQDFPGWSQGPILPTSSHWKGGPKHHYPMNKYLQNASKIVRQMLR